MLPFRVGPLLVLCMTGIGLAATLHDHLECFGIKDPQRPGATVAFDAPDVGMALGCTLRKARYYCAPAAGTVLGHDGPLLPISGPRLDTGRLCYKTDCPTSTSAERVESDQFGTRTLTAMRPTLICPPAAAGASAPLPAANDSLQCFKVKDPLRMDVTVALDTALGAESGCRVRRGRLLCVPGSLTVVRQHRRSVGAGGVGPASLTSDALCYAMRCPAPHPSAQAVADRFGSRTVKHLRPKLLCAPSQPGPVPSTTSTTSTTTTTSATLSTMPVTTVTTPVSTTTSTTSGPPDDSALRCQRAIERGGMAYAGVLVDAIGTCAGPEQTGSIRACLGGAAVVQALADARTAWSGEVVPACADTSVHATLGYLPTCALAPAACAFDAGVLDAAGANNDLLDCLACRVREGLTTAGTALFADHPATAPCHQAIAGGGLQVLESVLQQARTCLDQPDATSVAACFTPVFSAWRASAVATCGAVNPFVSYAYPSLCAGVGPPSFADCSSNVPPCNLPGATKLDTPVTDDDLLDCMECQTEEGVLSVLRTLYGANLCCVAGRCDTVRTRYGCRAVGGTPVYYRAAHVDVGPISGPHGIDVADDGTLYIADSGYARVKKRTAAGVVSIVGSTPFFPTGVAADPSGNVYVTNRCLHQLRKITPQGVSTVFAGTGVAGHSGDGGPAVNAQTVAVDGVTVDTAGNVYFTESGLMGIICGTFIPNADRVRMVDTAGIIHTVAGAGPATYTNPDGPALQAGLNVPYGLHVGPSGDLFIGEAGGERVFRFDPAASTVAWVAGRPLGGLASFAGDAGPARRMRFYENCGADEDGDGNVVIGPMSNNRIILVDKLGSAIVIAGNGLSYGLVDDAPATLTAAACPEDTAVGPDGRIWFSDIVNSNIVVLTRAPF